MLNSLDSPLKILAIMAAKQPVAIRAHRLFTKAAQQINPTSTMAPPTIEESVASPVFLIMSVMVEEARREERDACCKLAEAWVDNLGARHTTVSEYIAQERKKEIQ